MLCSLATKFNPSKPVPRVDAIVDVGGCVQSRWRKCLDRKPTPPTNTPPTNPSHEGAIIRAANMSVWNAPAIYRNTHRDSKHCQASGGSRTVLLNLSHLAWSVAEYTPLAIQKNKRPSCVWQPNSCADISRRPPTESSRARTPRRHMEIQTRDLPTQSVGPGGLILASRLKIKKERHVAQLWDAGRFVCSQPTQITTAERTGCFSQPLSPLHSPPNPTQSTKKHSASALFPFHMISLWSVSPPV